MAALTLVTAACTLGGTATSTTGTLTPSTSTSTSTSTPTASTTLATTTTAPNPTSTTQPAYYGPDWYWPEQQPGAEGAEGSGCTPGAGLLPDGYWFGMAVEHLEAEIVFDLACWFEDSNAPNGYRIENDNPSLRTIGIAEGVMVWRVDLDAEGGFAAPVPYAEWVGNYSVIVSCPGDFCLVWLRTEGGLIQEMVEQYVP